VQVPILPQAVPGAPCLSPARAFAERYWHWPALPSGASRATGLSAWRGLARHGRCAAHRHSRASIGDQ